MFDLDDQQRARSTPRPGRVGGSVAAHALLLVVLLHSGAPIRVRTLMPGTAKGTHIELSYLPGGASNPAKSADRRAASSHAAYAPLKAPAPAPVALPPVAADERQSGETPSSSASSGASSNSSNDALGTDDIQIALTTYSPSPRPDLSRLPRGTQGEVVLDVTIDPTGKVADLQILHALGYGVEEPVVETVRTWTFRPAMKDGVPVASVQELHFHFGPV